MGTHWRTHGSPSRSESRGASNTSGWAHSRPGDEKRAGEAGRRQSGAVIMSGPPSTGVVLLRVVDVAGTAETMTATLAFTDAQLRIVWAAADGVPVEKRGVFLQRVFARLQMHHGFTDADLEEAVRAALTGLIQSAA